MRNIKIVADSSANLLSLDDCAFSTAPLKVITEDREFVDDAALDVSAMVLYFDSYKGKSKTSCPNPSEWLDAFGDAEEVYCVAITSGLSGSYNSACIAKQMYEDEHPDRRVHVIDSLSAGPELVLLVEKLVECIRLDLPYTKICDTLESYAKNTGLLFMLESLKNFAANGRVSPAIAKIVGILGIRVVGKASDQGTLEPIDKCRGTEKSLVSIIRHLKEAGLTTGKVRIAHCANETAAEALKAKLLAELPEIDINVRPCGGLCSYYAEKGGLLVGYEKF